MLKITFSFIYLFAIVTVFASPFPISYLLNDNIEELVSSPCNLPAGFRTIVIDPGHGGNDEGCKTNKILEKDISLQIALKLGHQLKTSYPELQIIYTRESDRYVSLQDRIATANHNNADLFISVHCNYVQEKYVSGSETYVLGEDRKSQHLVNQEESHYHQEEFISSIRFKKLENHAYIKSLDLASKIEDSFAGLRGMKSRGVRHGAFRVLQMTTMPSVLVEAGFLSNKRDLKRLQSLEGQAAIAQSIYVACQNYFEELTEIENEGTPSAVVRYHPTPAAPAPFIAQPSTIPSKKYEIQIAEFTSIPLISKNEKWNTLKEIKIVQKDDRYLYMYGDFNNLAQAVKKQEELNAQGFKGAFVVEKGE
jgi:N-acetylmuramoyl-L-alanine amidase